MVRSFVKAAFRKFGYEIRRVPAELPPPEPSIHTCPGIDWNLGEADRFLATVVAKYRAEFERFPSASTATNTYHVSNPYFSRVDAAICHSFVREKKPELLVEIGCGMSSRVIRAALDLNGRGRLICIDPEPRADVRDIAHEWIQKPVQDVPLSFFVDLPSSAIVFIDSSHHAGAGSDVNYLFLEVLPSLKPGTMIHVHDIYLPQDYPSAERWGYSEQYLLHALLCFTSGFRILWPGRKMLCERDTALAASFPDAGERGLHCSFWMQRSSGSDPS